MFKIVQGINKCEDLLNLLGQNADVCNLRNRPLLNIANHRTNYGMNSPLDRTLRITNDMGN